MTHHLPTAQSLPTADALSASSATRAVATVDAVHGTQPTLTRATFEACLRAQLPELPPEWPEDDDLLDHGLDSVQVMELVADWKRHGVTTSFEDLARETTPRAWWRLLCGAGARD